MIFVGNKLDLLSHSQKKIWGRNDFHGIIQEEVKISTILGVLFTLYCQGFLCSYFLGQVFVVNFFPQKKSLFKKSFKVF